MRYIEYNFTYNKLEFFNILTVIDTFTEDDFNHEVNLIVEQVQSPSSAINNVSENNSMSVNVNDTEIKTYFDRHTVNDAARFIIAALIKELNLKLSDDLDLTKHLSYENNNIESSRDYPIIHIMPSEHEEFTFSTYPFHHTNDYLDSIIDGLTEHLIKTGVAVEKQNGDVQLINPKESILIESSMYGNRLAIGFVSKNEIKMSLRSKVSLILDSCVVGNNDDYKLSQAIAFIVSK